MNQAIALLGFVTNPLELVSFVLALCNVALNIRQSHWAWLFAIVSSVTYGMVFFHSRLYGDMGLQLVFIVVSAWGWYQWLRGAANGAQLPVTRLAGRGWALAGAGWLLGFAVLAWFLQTYTDTDVPRADGFLTAGSLLGQLLLSRKKLENWHIWIVVDVLYVGLYLYKNLMLTAILYAVFVVMAALGLRAWKGAADGAAADAMVLK
ncbi:MULTISPECIES: nicotinamide riboside transporter PnuC [unclassified Janthinobacterium]|uniref:nicotinamide riboside transporter PnuC n=1 Tax=unclassified Janthinobacterium TaxID=2610881 RepID=UPI0003467EB6|nr:MULTISPECIES: nicotinamide riboside transporter PnuC [unclassified Janthinobacterium]MEC5164025.1 nicotinamide mononucleotide transporter [Janthinobacterium sp. CG_S6]